jgi:hypothetical protein
MVQNLSPMPQSRSVYSLIRLRYHSVLSLVMGANLKNSIYLFENFTLEKNGFPMIES